MEGTVGLLQQLKCKQPQATVWISGLKEKVLKIGQFWRIQDETLLLFHWMLEILILVNIRWLYFIKAPKPRKITMLIPLKILILLWCFPLVRVKLLKTEVEVKLKKV
ncbi:hypothetical protein V6Z12_D05G369400 [Gossypium hirsutum]